MDSLTSYQYVTCIDQLARTLFFSACALQRTATPYKCDPRFKGIWKGSSRATPWRGLFAAAARAATPEASLARAPARDHAHRRGLLYLRRASPGFPTGRPCVPARIPCSGRRLEEPESTFDLGNVAHVLGRAGNGPRQVWSHRAPGLTRSAQAKSRTPCSAPACPLRATSTARADVARSARVWAR